MANSYVGNCQTYPIQHGTDDLCNRCAFCSFVTKRCDRDDRWNFFKGRIISKHQTARKILVKSIRDNKSLSSTECHAEVEKLRLAKKVADLNPGLRVGVFSTYYSEIDEIGVRCGGSSSGDVEEGMCVLMQERTKEQIEDFRPLGSSSQGGHKSYSHPQLLEFVRAAYRFSNGRYVISGVKGFKRGDSGSAAYFLTSVTVHSVGKEFGVTDKGQDGVTAFLSCGGLQNTDIPRNISSTASGSETDLGRLQPSAPEPEDSTTSESHTRQASAPTGKHPSLLCSTVISMDTQAVETPPPAYEISWRRQSNTSVPLSLDPPPGYPEPENSRGSTECPSPETHLV